MRSPEKRTAFVRARLVIKDNQFGEDDLELNREMNKLLLPELTRGINR